MSHPLTTVEVADLIGEQAIEAIAHATGMSTSGVRHALRVGHPFLVNEFTRLVRAGADAAQRMHELGLLPLSA